MKRRYRLRRNERFQEIRQKGKAFSSDLIVLCALPNQMAYSRFGFAVSARIGGAVDRNRIKRQLRESMRLRLAQVKPGWDIVVIARRPIRGASFWSMDAACARLLGRAHLLIPETLPASRQPADAPVAAPASAPVSAADEGAA